MCRIAGIINNNPDTAISRQKVKAMCNALQHGGPDDEGIFAAANGVVFGHRRLSIIDLSANGHQPMADVDEKAWIVFNGEIYNYQDLKTDLLAQGASFRSGTDTEVIIQAYLHWGVAAFAKLRGIFAFALYDVNSNLTYLVRDSKGVKPLYYHADKGELSFASEVSAFKAAGITNQDNPSWHIRFLAFGHVPEPDTTLKNVYSLAKGNMLCWDNNKQTFAINKYASLPATELITRADEAQEAISKYLRLAVKRQLIADAPIGVFLSGGVDSSLLTLLAAEHKHDHLKTISIFFNESAYDEHAFQDIVNSRIKGQNFSHLIQQTEFNECLPAIIAAMDMPTTDGINSWFISKYAHQDGLKAVLSGLGADELFGGYPSFNRVSFIRLLQKLPGFLLKSAAFASTDRYKKISYLSNPSELALYLTMRALFAPSDIAKLVGCDERQVNSELFEISINIDKNLSSKELASWLESNIYMQNQLLRDTDVMSMSHGLEVRVPFLDEDFQNVVSSISPALLFDKRQPKKLLIDSFKEVLPETIWNRPKMGFSFPLQAWMRNHPEIANEHLYKGEYAKSVITNFKNNRTHWSKAFVLYLTQLHAQ